MKKFLIGIAIGTGMLALACFLVIPQLSFGDVTQYSRSESNRYQEYTFFATSTTGYIATSTVDGSNLYGTTTTATSTDIDTWTNSDGRIDKGYFVIQGAEDVNLLFERSDEGFGNTGTTTYAIQVTETDNPTEQDWYDYDQLQEITSGSSADTYFTRVASVSAGASDTNDHAATSTSLYTMDNNNFYAIRCVVVEETDGLHECRAVAKF